MSLRALYDARIANHLQSMVEAGWSVTYINWSHTRDLPRQNGLDQIVLDHRNDDPVIGLNPFKFIRILAWFRSRAVAADAQIYQIDDLFLLPLAPLLPGKVVYDVHENYLNWPGKIRNFARAIYPFFLPFVDGFASTCKANLTPTQKPTAIIPNCQSKQQYDNIESQPQQATTLDMMTVVYFGSLSSIDRDVTVMLESASQCLKSATHIRFMFAGPLSGPRAEADLAKFQELARQYPDRFQWLGEVSREQVVRLTKNADVGLIFLLDRSPNMLGGSWNKIYEYLLAGAAILATRGFDIADQVQQNKAGILFDTHVTADTLSRQLLQLADDRAQLDEMKRASAKLGKSYAWEKVAHRYIDLYEQLGVTSPG